MASHEEWRVQQMQSMVNMVPFICWFVTPGVGNSCKGDKRHGAKQVDTVGLQTRQDIKMRQAWCGPMLYCACRGLVHGQGPQSRGYRQMYVPADMMVERGCMEREYLLKQKLTRAFRQNH